MIHMLCDTPNVFKYKANSRVKCNITSDGKKFFRDPIYSYLILSPFHECCSLTPASINWSSYTVFKFALTAIHGPFVMIVLVLIIIDIISWIASREHSIDVRVT